MPQFARQLILAASMPRSPPADFPLSRKLAALPINRDDEPEGAAAESAKPKTDLAQSGRTGAGLGAESAR